MQLLNTRVLDETAVGWGTAIDESIQKERYRRGELFVNAAVNLIQP